MVWRPGKLLASPRREGAPTATRTYDLALLIVGAGSLGLIAFVEGRLRELVELATMVVAAVMPLPAAPVVQGNPSTDMTNQLAYTSALALHAKRDEQLRTVGALVGKLVG